jgi:flagellar basal-body rod protein FlgB
VNTIDDAALIEALRQQMTKSVARQVAAAGNLANVDTPNYKAVEPSFADALKGQLAVKTTKPGHINPSDASGRTCARFRTPWPAATANVEIDRELLSMTAPTATLPGADGARRRSARALRHQRAINVNLSAAARLPPAPAAADAGRGRRFEP